MLFVNERICTVGIYETAQDASYKIAHEHEINWREILFTLNISFVNSHKMNFEQKKRQRRRNLEEAMAKAKKT